MKRTHPSHGSRSRRCSRCWSRRRRSVSAPAVRAFASMRTARSASWAASSSRASPSIASQAAITINGEAGHSADDLLPGMVAGVDGNVVPGLQVGVATSIHVTRVVRGWSLHVGTGGTGLRIRMAGIDVIPRADVVVAGCASLADVTVGTTLDVYGYSDGITGAVDATRIECVGPSGEVELHGVASAITPSSMVVDGVTVDISGAQFIGFVMPTRRGRPRRSRRHRDRDGHHRRRR